MSYQHFIINDCDFGKINEIYQLPYDVIMEFISNVINKHPNKDILLPNLSNILVIIANKYSEDYLRNSELSWDYILNKEQYDFLSKNKKYIIGWMYIDPSKNYKSNVHYIDFIDTIVRGYNLAKKMINKYEKNNNVKLYPQEIIPSSAKYWIKHINIDCDEKITSENIYKYIKANNLDPQRIVWDSLIGLSYNIDDSDNTDFGY